MSRHQKQSHTKSTKRTCLQWRPLNEILISNKPKPKKNWRPLDDVLNDGILLQQKLDQDASVNNTCLPASPVPSEHSTTTLDEDLISSPILLPTVNILNQWYPSPFDSNTNHYYNNQYGYRIQQLHHHHH